jgi:hypothetical protein
MRALMSDYEEDARVLLRVYDTFERVWGQKSAALGGYLEAMRNTTDPATERHAAHIENWLFHETWGIENEFAAARRLYRLEDIRKRLYPDKGR